MWYNNTNSKCYKGSGINLYKRLSNYYQNSYLKRCLFTGEVFKNKIYRKDLFN